MILFAHMLFGAATGSIIKNSALAVVLAFFGHYFLDLFPHVDYSVDNLKNKDWKKSLPDISKLSLDIFSAFLIIFLFSFSMGLVKQFILNRLRILYTPEGDGVWLLRLGLRISTIS